jgi:xanthine dehydrogenase accessory factor
MKGDVFKELIHAARSQQPVALGIITRVMGSSPQKLGAKALFYPDGRIHGTLGGGCLEAEIQRRAIHSLSSGKAETFELLLDHDFGWDDGLICGGKVYGLILPNAESNGESFWSKLQERKHPTEWGVKSDYSIALLDGNSDSAELLYRETVTPPWTLWIAGAGHISQAVAPLAVQLDFDVTVFDDRPALLNREFFPLSVRLQADVWEKLLSANVPTEPCFALIVTRGHRHDALVLRHWIQQRFLFLGMIGSARKARTIFDHFRDEHLANDEQLQRVACPVGIRIKSSSVMEIAVSIVAQFIEKRAELGATSR